MDQEVPGNPSNWTQGICSHPSSLTWAGGGNFQVTATFIENKTKQESKTKQNRAKLGTNENCVLDHSLKRLEAMLFLPSPLLLALFFSVVVPVSSNAGDLLSANVRDGVTDF